MAKRKRHEEHENHERWLVSYADFITLLFAFFVVMYATSNQDQIKAVKFEGAIRNSLNLGQFGGGHNPINLESGSMIAPMGVHMIDGSPIDLQNYYMKKVNTMLNTEEKGKLIQDFSSDATGVRIRLQGSNLFEPGSTKLTGDAVEALNKLGIVLKRGNRRFIVEGHTDDLPSETPGMTNWELGALRSTAVVRHLIDNFGIPANKVAAASYADTKPIASNKTAEGRAENRRIEIFIPGMKAADTK
jgi:chemotaxis protein MotB